MQLKKVLAGSAVALSLAATALQAQTWSGTTLGGPTWNRPVANGSNAPVAPLSGVGTAVAYSFQSFLVNVSGSYSFLSTANSPAAWDNYTFLYAGSFNPASPFANVLIGNDDQPSAGLSGFTTNLVAGNSYVFVTTGFGNGDQGSFTNTIRGQADVTLTSPVPEPSTWALMAFGVAGLGIVARRRNRSA